MKLGKRRGGSSLKWHAVVTPPPIIEESCCDNNMIGNCHSASATSTPLGPNIDFWAILTAVHLAQQPTALDFHDAAQSPDS